MFKKIVIIIFVLFQFQAWSQNNKFIGNIKTIKEKLIYLDSERKPKLNEPCLDCDNDSYYQYGTSIEPSLNEHTEIFDEQWIAAPFSNYKNKVIIFSKENLKTEEILFEHTKKVRAKVQYNYNDANQKISEVLYNRYLGHSIKNLNYDKSNNLKTEFYTTDNYSVFKNYFYENNVKVKTEIYNQSGFKNQIIHKETDSLGFRIQENYRISDKIDNYKFNKFDLYLKNTFDKNNNLLITNYYQLDSLKLVNTLSSFYKNGLIIKELRKQKKKINIDTIEYSDDITYYEYDIDNHLIKKERFINGKSFQKTTYKYSNNLLNEVLSNKWCEKEYKINFKYKFDKKGNCVKEYKFVNDKPAYLLKRKIQYYN
ncbi:hypothetical protein [Flavobacterium urocaniciphilum]|uniref:YD repeat-containing protein n=1 Tax=Flavobacterium urocaniciphilum TaxID=1299341 RepID=A0A1H8YTM3_9FLAO|nr:hypothetical protein [Flavobacterium urocaniciphilum]SEP55555.1 hypothetical protein SAMN05444005_101212 [Flavobacterium urocaniciphilum]